MAAHRERDNGAASRDGGTLTIGATARAQPYQPTSSCEGSSHPELAVATLHFAPSPELAALRALATATLIVDGTTIASTPLAQVDQDRDRFPYGSSEFHPALLDLAASCGAAAAPAAADYLPPGKHDVAIEITVSGHAALPARRDGARRPYRSLPSPSGSLLPGHAAGAHHGCCGRGSRVASLTASASSRSLRSAARCTPPRTPRCRRARSRSHVRASRVTSVIARPEMAVPIRATP